MKNPELYACLFIMIVLAALFLTGCDMMRPAPNYSVHQFAKLERVYGGYNQYMEFTEKNQ